MVLIQDIPTLALNLPIIISLIAVIRYIVGFKTWKNYPVIALSLAYFAFYQLLENHFVAFLIWLLNSIVILGTALGTRYLLRKIKMNYYSRVAMMYLAATVAGLLFMIAISITTYGTLVQNHYYNLGLFLIGTTIDELASLQFKKDMQEFLRRVISTTGIGLLGGLLLTWSWWNHVLGGHQEILVIVLLVDIIAAFWSALRVTELVRFNSILRS